MAFEPEKYKRMFIHDGGALHLYISDEAAATIAAANFFLPNYQKMNVGDLILARADLDGTPATALYAVATCSAAGVTVV